LKTYTEIVTKAIIILT